MGVKISEMTELPVDEVTEGDFTVIERGALENFRVDLGALVSALVAGALLSENNLSDVTNALTSIQNLSPILYNFVVNGGADPVTTQAGTAYTAVTADANSYIVFTAATAIDFTIPAGLPTNCRIAFEQSGAGAITPVAGVGVTINSVDALTSSRAQGSVCQLKQTAPNVYRLFGDIS